MKKTSFSNANNIIILLIYSVVTVCTSLCHEMWFDEAEAWSIVKYNGISELYDILKSEGHPFLWYALIKAAVNFNISPLLMPVFSCFFSILTAVLILWKSPFNVKLNILILFSSCVLYYNSVMSRVYCLIPLLLCSIAILYPDRKKHPILFGILIALLTNTHVFMSGLVATIGIYMIIDIVSDWRKNSLYQNLCNIAGTAIAGAGVIAFLIVMTGSLGTNAETSSDSRNTGELISNIGHTIYDIGAEVSVPFDIGIVPELFSSALICTVILMVFFLRNRGRAFAFIMSFIAGFILVCGVIWRTNPNRSAIFLFMFVFCLWIAEESNVNTKKTDFSDLKTDTRLITEILAFIEKKDRESIISYRKLLMFSLAITVPAGIGLCVADLKGDFSVEKNAVSYVREHYNPEDTVIISDMDLFPEISLYTPEFRTYALQLGEYYRYHDHRIVIYDADREFDYNKSESELAKYNNIIYVCTVPAIDRNNLPSRNLNYGELIYYGKSDIIFDTKLRYIELYKVSMSELKEKF